MDLGQRLRRQRQDNIPARRVSTSFLLVFGVAASFHPSGPTWESRPGGISTGDAKDRPGALNNAAAG